MPRARSFNPRSHMGSDVMFVKMLLISFVSIHAPTWGATLHCRWTSCHRCFNPRSHMGSDIYSFPSSSQPSVFQSTLPHGERHTDVNTQGKRSCFNPRSHMGSDLKTISVKLPTRGFNPRSHMGSDHSNKQNGCNHTVSIHAPTWGATVHSLYFSFTMSYNTIFTKEPNVIIYISLFLQFNI